MGRSVLDLRRDLSLAMAKDQSLPDSARGAIRAGFIIIAVFFGGFGTWAATAPLNGAVVGNAIVKVEGNRKSVQHVDGGMVRELRVKDGDKVQQGDVLVVLDDSAIRAEVEVLSQQYVLLRSVEGRLKAELAGSDAIAFAPDLVSGSDDGAVAAAMEAQRQELAGRKRALDGQAQVLGQRIAQLRESIAGAEGRRAAYQKQLDSVTGEAESLSDLLAKGLITRERMLQLERTEAGIRGQLADTDAEISRNREAIGEYQDQISLLGKDRAAAIAAELRDTQAKLLEVIPRLENAKISLGRTVVRAPYSGTVVGLNIFSVGGVIGRGERILDIVPERSSLVVEARIGVEDIADVHPGMSAEVHFTSYKQRTIPLISGTVTEISADRLTDERSGMAFYTVLVTVDAVELAKSPQIKLYPGMPATVMITTEQRTALDYLIGPLAASFDRSFRER
jgi:HlyD family type I secretion membrane fusion protein